MIFTRSSTVRLAIVVSSFTVALGLLGISSAYSQMAPSKPKVSTSPSTRTQHQTSSPTVHSNSGSTHSPSSGSAVSSSSEPVLRVGSRGEAVKKLQTLLQKKHFYQEGSTDGIFGLQTLNAVKSFQQSAHLTADGVVGSQTWAALSHS